MFEVLTEKLQRIFKTLRGEGKLTEENIAAVLAQLRVALLEADVHFRIVAQFIENIRAKALGQEVMLAFSPDQQVIKIVRDELLALLGRDPAPLRFAKKPPSIYFIVGLQGSGKTTTAGKLARWLSKRGHRPLLVSTDVRRPAAREQLAQIAQAVNLPCYNADSDSPLALLKGARREAELSAYDIILVDTQGRLHIDAELMGELVEMQRAVAPVETLFIADAMTGQDAVRSAQTFHEQLPITGVILTKLDGDARGGAALSIRWVTGQPIKFIGVGEKYDQLEPFHPQRIVSRILGMGDVLSLIEKAEEVIDHKRAEELERKLRKDEFTLEDFRDQLRQLRKLGPLEQVLSMLPGLGPQLTRNDLDERRFIHLGAIIDSMTSEERRHPEVIDGKRRRRIARGSGTSVQQVNQLLRQFVALRKLMKEMKGGKGKAADLARKLGAMKPPM